jgi:hypothetical protein
MTKLSGSALGFTNQGMMMVMEDRECCDSFMTSIKQLTLPMPLSLSALKRHILFYKLRKYSNIFQDFENADHPVSFFIRAIIRRNNNIEDISYENDNEKLVIKKANHDENWEKLLISRYPRKAAKKWIDGNEKEITEWKRKKLNRKISL